MEFYISTTRKSKLDTNLGVRNLRGSSNFLFAGGVKRRSQAPPCRAGVDEAHDDTEARCGFGMDGEGFNGIIFIANQLC
jgi:hypothetical protein